MTPRWIGAMLLAAPLALASCKQGVNERCQVDSDCDDGLTCVLPSGGNRLTGGTCQPPGGGPDMSVMPDQGPAPDLGRGDLSTSDLSAKDLSDLSTKDLGPGN